MRALVTGGNGFLGSHLVMALLERGDSVTVLERRSSDTSRISGALPHISFYSLDATGCEMPLPGVEGAELVFHTATSYGREGESPLQVFETNTAFSLRLLNLAADHGVGTFVNMDTSVDESLNAYALSKKQFVSWGKYYACRKAVRFLNAELEHFYGPGDSRSKFTTDLVNGLLADVPEIALTAGEQKRDFIYIDDAVSAILLLADEVHAAGTQAEGHFFNCPVGSGKAVSIRQFAELARSIAGSRTKLDFGAVPYRKNEVMFSQADIGFLEKIGWSPAFTLDEGIRRTVEGEKDRSAGINL